MAWVAVEHACADPLQGGRARSWPWPLVRARDLHPAEGIAHWQSEGGLVIAASAPLTRALRRFVQDEPGQTETNAAHDPRLPAQFAKDVFRDVPSLGLAPDQLRAVALPANDSETAFASALQAVGDELLLLSGGDEGLARQVAWFLSQNTLNNAFKAFQEAPPVARSPRGRAFPDRYFPMFGGAGEMRTLSASRAQEGLAQKGLPQVDVTAIRQVEGAIPFYSPTSGDLFTETGALSLRLRVTLERRGEHIVASRLRVRLTGELSGKRLYLPLVG